MAAGTMKSVVAAAAFALVATAAFSAHAACNQFGEIVRHSQSTTGSTVYLRNTTLSNIVWFCSTSNDRLQSAANAAAANGNRVLVSGNAASCPTAGTARPMGICNLIVLHP